MKEICQIKNQELLDSIQQALEALENVPRVGGVYTQQIADMQLAAHRKLQDILETLHCD